MVYLEKVSFQTLDGTTLRGCLYPAKQRGPGIIALPGFSFVKEMLSPKVAAFLQQAGFTTLAYDPRTLGESDGMPRCDIDPVKQVGDYHDALTFLMKHPKVDADRIAYWGFSFNGVIALNAAALDKRAKCVIVVNPLTDIGHPADQRAILFADAMKDREAQLAGGPPAYVPIMNEDGTCPYGWGTGGARREYQLATQLKALFPTFQNHITLQTHCRVAAWRPYELMPLVAPTPVMIVTSGKDMMSLPEKQKALFEGLEEPKDYYFLPGISHSDALTGKHFNAVMSAQVNFLSRHMVGEDTVKVALL
ncbi:DltD N-terminal domain protein [Xylariales sp. AK1849]|nr:DltD N-terminal domain protein [Xylariales sp. AK1849]